VARRRTRSGHSPVLLDHLVGAGEDQWRDRQAKHLCGLQVDDQLESGRLLDWQISRLGAGKNPADIGSSLTPGFVKVAPIADQAAGARELAPLIDRRHRMVCRKRHELLTPAENELVAADDERARLRLDKKSEDSVNFALGAGI